MLKGCRKDIYFKITKSCLVVNFEGRESPEVNRLNLRKDSFMLHFVLLVLYIYLHLLISDVHTQYFWKHRLWVWWLWVSIHDSSISKPYEGFRGIYYKKKNYQINITLSGSFVIVNWIFFF